MPLEIFIRLRRRPRALPVDECVSRAKNILCRCAALLRRISPLADNPPKPWRKRVFSWRYHGLCPWGSIIPVGEVLTGNQKFPSHFFGTGPIRYDTRLFRLLDNNSPPRKTTKDSVSSGLKFPSFQLRSNGKAKTGWISNPKPL